MRSRAALLLSIVLGAIAAVMILTWARGRESELLQLSQMKDVLVATKDIPANTIIDESLVQRRQVPIDVHAARSASATSRPSRGG